MKTTLLKALREQLNYEMNASYLYLGISAYFDSENLPGFASWMRKQSAEEFEHAMKFYNHLVKRGERVVLGAVKAPPEKWSNHGKALEAALKAEQQNTSQINRLVDIAVKEKDHASRVFLDWFVTEQVEEEATAKDLLDKLKLVGGTPQGLYLLDKELSQRA